MKKQLLFTALFNITVSIAAFFAITQESYGVGLGEALTHRQVYMIERQGVISSNIANSTTPGYVAKDLMFEPLKARSSMKMKRTSGKHLGFANSYKTGKIFKDKRNMRHDRNSVKLDEQMLKLSEVQMQHRFISNLKSKHKAMQNMAISANAR